MQTACLRRRRERTPGVPHRHPPAGTPLPTPLHAPPAPGGAARPPLGLDTPRLTQCVNSSR
jgi:hypothetical protein